MLRPSHPQVTLALYAAADTGIDGMWERAEQTATIYAAKVRVRTCLKSAKAARQ